MTLLSTYINQLNKPKILVIGDIMLDRFIYGKVERISPEAPVPIFLVNHEKEMLGGAGNVVANLASLGCQVVYVGIVGNDHYGSKLATLLSEIKAHYHLLKIKNYATIVKTRLISDKNHLVRVDQEEKLPIVKEQLSRFQRILTQVIRNVDIVLLSDYNKGVLTSDTVPMIIEICKQHNKRILIDPKGKDYSKYAGATFIKPNLKELTDATGLVYQPKDPEFDSQLKKGAKILFDKYKIPNLLVTLSEYGMAFMSSKTPDDLIKIPTDAKEVCDVSGAGDTSLALIGAAIGADVPIQDAMKLANLASGIVVGKLGTATVTLDELQEALTYKEPKNNAWHQKNKILSSAQASKIAHQAHLHHKIVGFTNGCFDLLHFGHLHSLMEAKKHCDLLFVGLNSDASVKRYEGESRPIQDEKTRALLLASLEYVDYVVVFDEDTALPLIKAIKPDIIAKEGYAIDKWPEAQAVIAYGGKAITLPKINGYSTSALVSKMKG